VLHLRFHNEHTIQLISKYGAFFSLEKPDGSIEVCGNYIKLNRITELMQYPFPNMHHALQSLGKE
jgi:hypothetical protein